MKILFVCSGNVGRSQIAESIFNKITNGKHHAESAGTDVTSGDNDDREGQLLKENQDAATVIEAMNEIGIDMSEKVRKQIKSGMIVDADKIVMMTRPKTVLEHIKAHPQVVFWDVADPYHESLEFTRRVRDRINSLVEDLINSFD